VSIGRINIAGAGLAGCLIAIYLARDGYSVHIYEKRRDVRRTPANSFRSLNLVLSRQSMRLLEEAGLSGLHELAVPLRGRMMHTRSGNTVFAGYGNGGGDKLSELMPLEGGYSLSRAALNTALLNAAEQQGAEIRFEQAVTECDPASGELSLVDGSGIAGKVPGDAILGCDGVSSVVRQTLAKQPGFVERRLELGYGYKELRIPPGPAGSFLIEEHALHLWPRAGFIMSALPDPDGSFNCNLFLPLAGANGFGQLQSPETVQRFFAENCPDMADFVPDLAAQFLGRPVNSLAAMQCWPWCSGKALLLGDACHTLYPFSGLGANLALEDCVRLMKCILQFSPDLERAFLAYSTQRKSTIEGLFERTAVLAPLVLAFLPEEGVTGTL
jgi:kynurenine 3-monooxygenase